tara:strand:- start:158 stop:646 length:489 start_codon:yes stop_codon:yes gene_type:complete
MNCINIFGYDGKYEIDTDGNVFSNVGGTRKKLTPRYNGIGYHTIQLVYNKKSTHFLIHKLVAFHFIENDDAANKIRVCHKNQIRTDNRVENLEWVSNLTNCQNYNQFDNKRNKSGHKNIYYDRQNNHWKFGIHINRKRICKQFKTKQEAIEYKQEFLKNMPN